MSPRNKLKLEACMKKCEQQPFGYDGDYLGEYYNTDPKRRNTRITQSEYRKMAKKELICELKCIKKFS